MLCVCLSVFPPYWFSSRGYSICRFSFSFSFFSSFCSYVLLFSFVFFFPSYPSFYSPRLYPFQLFSIPVRRFISTLSSLRNHYRTLAHEIASVFVRIRECFTGKLSWMRVTCLRRRCKEVGRDEETAVTQAFDSESPNGGDKRSLKTKFESYDDCCKARLRSD